jgi:hypothetical protein
MSETIRVTVNGKPVTVSQGSTVAAAILLAGRAPSTHPPRARRGKAGQPERSRAPVASFVTLASSCSQLLQHSSEPPLLAREHYGGESKGQPAAVSIPARGSESEERPTHSQQREGGRRLTAGGKSAAHAVEFLCARRPPHAPDLCSHDALVRAPGWLGGRRDALPDLGVGVICHRDPRARTQRAVPHTLVMIRAPTCGLVGRPKVASQRRRRRQHQLGRMRSFVRSPGTGNFPRVLIREC